MTSIFAKDLSGGVTITPRELIAHEIGHLEGMGRSRWRTTPLMATCRTVSALVFFVVLALYFLDPFLYAINKSRAVDAYLYLTHFGDPEDVQSLTDCGMFTARDMHNLAIRTQTVDPSAVQNYFISTTDAKRAIRQAEDYMHEVNALQSGNLTDANRLTRIRYHLFRHFGIITPREWTALNPVMESD